MVHTVIIPPSTRIYYSYDLPIPSAQSYIWIGFVRQDDVNTDFMIFDRNNNQEIYKTLDKGEYLAKLYFYQKERLEFSFLNVSVTKVTHIFEITPGTETSGVFQMYVLPTRYEC